jgi:hypothetical protein
MATRTNVRMMWSSVAAGRIDEDTAAWLADVARKVLAADKLKGNGRRSALAAATGLRGSVEDEQGQMTMALRGAQLEIEAGRLQPGRASVREFVFRILQQSSPTPAAARALHDLDAPARDKRIARALELFEDQADAASLRSALNWTAK